MRIQSKLMALAVISTLAVPLAGCGSPPGSDLEAAFYLFALPIYAIACAAGGCGSSATSPEQVQQVIEEQERQHQKLRTKWKTRAEQGDPEAQFRLYELSPHDPERMKWLCLSANQGYAEAQNRLGTSYRYGWGVERSLVQAYKWYALEIEAGNTDARRDHDDIAPSMTPAQIAEAERLAAEWTPESPCPSVSVEAATPSIPPVRQSTVAPVDPGEGGRNVSRSCTNPAYANLPECREWLAAWNAAHTEGRPPPSPIEPLQGTATVTPSTPSSNAPASPAQPTTPPPARIAAPSTAPSVQGPAATQQTGTPVGDSPSAPVVDPVGRCAPSVRHLGGSYCATDPNRS
jgi:hypothetical protein